MPSRIRLSYASCSCENASSGNGGIRNSLSTPVVVTVKLVDVVDGENRGFHDSESIDVDRSLVS